MDDDLLRLIDKTDQSHARPPPPLDCCWTEAIHPSGHHSQFGQQLLLDGLELLRRRRRARPINTETLPFRSRGDGRLRNIMKVDVAHILNQHTITRKLISQEGADGTDARRIIRQRT